MTADEEGIGTHGQEATNISVGKALPFPNTTVAFVMGEVDHGLGLLVWKDREEICSAIKLVGVYFSQVVL